MITKLLSLSVSLIKIVSPSFGTRKIQSKYFILSSNFAKIMGSVCAKNMTQLHSDTSIMDDTTEFVEDVVCKDSDIQENEMKIFDLSDAGKVLLVRQNGKLSALGTKCSHYGAPLDKAVLGEGRIRCQWHGACFNISTGDIEDFPGLDSLPCYQVSIENDNVKVRARRTDLQANKRVKTMVKQDLQQKQHMVVIGGGPSGACCVETLRQEGFTGRITLVNKENAFPYDRIKYSKALDLDVAKAEIRSKEFYKENGIDVLKNTEATKIDTKNKIVTLHSGETLNYDCLYIATGSVPRMLSIPGADLKNVCILRNYEHGNYIHSQLTPEKHVVVLGVGFIGIEAAAYCAGKVAQVTVIGRDDVPFKPVFGEAIGDRVMRLLKEKGVNFIMNNGIKQCVGKNGQLTSVELNDGSILQADICITGIGSTFATEFLKLDSGIELNPNGSITVNEFMESNVKNVFAGGDIANAPVYISNNQNATIGHFGLAHLHGRIAALNMLGKAQPLKAVPFFWTMILGKNIRYVGHGSFDSVQIYGDLEELKFLAYYYRNDEVVAMAGCQRDPIISQFAETLAQGKRINRTDVESGKLIWTNN